MLIIFIILVVSAPGISQKAIHEDIVNISRLSFPDLGYSYELRVGKFKSLVGKIAVNPVIAVPTPFILDNNSPVPGFAPIGSNFTLENSGLVTLVPTVSLSYRNYYNFNKRKNQNLKTAMNSLNYYSPIIISRFTQDNLQIPYIPLIGGSDAGPHDNNYVYTQSQQSYINTIGFVWGIQRNYSNRFSFDLSTGLGINNLYTKTNYSDGTSEKTSRTTLTPIIQVSLGVWLNKVK